MTQQLNKKWYKVPAYSVTGITDNNWKVMLLKISVSQRSYLACPFSKDGTVINGLCPFLRKRPYVTNGKSACFMLKNGVLDMLHVDHSSCA